MVGPIELSEFQFPFYNTKITTHIKIGESIKQSELKFPLHKTKKTTHIYRAPY